MSVTVINSSNEEDFEEIGNLFYNHFSPDDWDYVIMGEDKNEVEDLAYKLQIFDYKIEPIPMKDPMTNWDIVKWVAVTYHS